MTTTEKGRFAELSAANYLRSKGYEIVATNYHTRYGEIDIIARDAEKILYVEVKGRRGGSFERPGEAVTASKIAKIMKAAHHYAATYNIRIPHRFDIIEVYLTEQEQQLMTLKIVHFENTFPN